MTKSTALCNVFMKPETSFYEFVVRYF